MRYLTISLLFLCIQSSFGAATKDVQFQKSLKTIIANATMPDVYPGMIVASPSRRDPDYYYDWVRDTALTMRSLIDYYELTKDAKIKRMIFTWIDAEARRQNLPAISGLGEPKYTVDGYGYTGGWGRPQNDGPALRAIAMIKFARILLAEGNSSYVLKRLYHGVLPADSVIKKDLEYTAHHWQEMSFDIWEEEKGIHFYTQLAQYTALQEGAKLARELKDDGAAIFYELQTKKLAQALKEFLDPQIGIKVTTKREGYSYKTSNLDVAPLLALLHTSPYQNLFPFNHPNVVKYVSVLTETFGKLYPVNKAYPALGVSIGRYPEDRYNGVETTGVGNPWFLATIALAEYQCLKGEKASVIERQFQRVLFHSDKGSLSEQFNQITGYMQGAVELTWSHNSYLTAAMRCRMTK